MKLNEIDLHKELKKYFVDYQLATQTSNKDTIEGSLKKYFTNYLKYIFPYKGLLVQVFFGMLMGILISLLFPFITQSIVDIGIETSDFSFINILLTAMIVLTISSVFSQYVQSRMMLYVADRVNISMVSDFIQKTLKIMTYLLKSYHLMMR